MTLQRRLERIILDLGDIRDECRFTDEGEALDRIIGELREVRITSDQFT